MEAHGKCDVDFEGEELSERQSKDGFQAWGPHRVGDSPGVSGRGMCSCSSLSNLLSWEKVQSYPCLRALGRPEPAAGAWNSARRGLKCLEKQSTL